MSAQLLSRRYCPAATVPPRRVARRLLATIGATDPVGVAVFHVFLDPKAREYETLRTWAVERVAADHPEALIKRFLGSTPLRWQDDPDRPLEHDAVLAYAKAARLPAAHTPLQSDRAQPLRSHAARAGDGALIARAGAGATPHGP